MTIDIAHECLYLAKGKQFTRPDKGHTSGMGPLFKAGVIEVGNCQSKGASLPAGLRVGDVIVTLCGKSVSHLKSSEVHRLLRMEGKPISMTIERGGKQMEISFTPKEYD